MGTAATIVVVDDDPRIRELLRACFEAESYRVLEASDSRTLFALLDEHTVDLVTLDIALVGESGLDLVREIRASHDLGIVMVTGKGELIDTVLGLELGADDYIVKPFELRELLARVRSVLRRYERNRGEEGRGAAAPTARGGAPADEEPIEIAFGPWRLRPAARLLLDADGSPLELTGSEFDLLEFLVENPQRVLSRDEIMARLKGRDWHPSDRIIDNLVAQLRKKFEQGGRSAMIDTVRGKGYRFSGTVERR